jgi:hypothetical protein
MKLRVADGCVAPGQFFKIVTTGYALGVITIFAPLFALISVFVLFGAPLGDGRWPILLFPVLLPIIAIGQGAMFGVITTLGLWVYRSKRRIEIAGPAEK